MEWNKKELEYYMKKSIGAFGFEGVEYKIGTVNQA